jgi:peptide/nickel transport system substrate-binding protein
MGGSKGGKGSTGFKISRSAAEAGWFFSFTSFSSFVSSISFTSLLLAALLALASCSHDSPTEPGVVNFLIESMPVNLDPRIGTDAQSERIDGLIFDSLIELDEQRNPKSDLAETWEMPDPRTYIFHLRSGVKFHDGRPLTSADVKYTFNSIINGTVTSPKKGTLRFVTSVETPDANTVIFRLSEPSSGLLPDISRPAMGVVPVGAGTDFAEHPIGTGAFRFVSAQQDDSVVLERNATYFRAPAKIDQVRFRVVPEAVVRALELRKGTADLEETSLTPDMIPVLRSEPGIEVAEQPGSNYAYIAFNFDDTVLGKREVRQALALATDRDTIIHYLLRGQARKADGPLPPNSWAYEPNIRHYGYDPQQAESLLDSAGFPRRADEGGVRLKLTIKTSTEESTRLLGEALQEQWRKVGVELELKPEEIATLLSDLTRGSFQLSTLRWIGVNNDPEFFEFAFSSKRIPPMGANRGRYRNAMLDALMDQARVQTDREKRRQLYSEIQKEVAEELPYLSLWHFDNISVHRKRISNIELAPSGDFDFLRNIEAQ